eukprot:scaffold5.g995.t1
MPGYIRGLPPTATEDDLRSVFGRHGQVDTIKLVQAPQPYAFVRFLQREAAAAAIAGLSGVTLPGGAEALVVRTADHDAAAPGTTGGNCPSELCYARELPCTFTRDAVAALFGAFGGVVDVKLFPQCGSSKLTGALVKMASLAAAACAIAGLNGAVLPGCTRSLLVRYADTPEERVAKQARRAQAALLQQVRGASPMGASPSPAAVQQLQAELLQTLGEAPAPAPAAAPPPPAGAGAGAAGLPAPELMEHLARLAVGTTAAGLAAGGPAPAAPGEPPQPEGTCILVEGLPDGAERLWLYEHFSPFGAVTSVAAAAGAGRVAFRDPATARAACEAAHGLWIGSCQLRVAVEAPAADSQLVAWQRALGAGGGDTDNQPLLSQVAARLERVGLRPPEITLRFRNLSVRAHMVISDRTIPTLSRTATRQLEPALRVVGRAPPRTLFPIVDDVSGIVRPGVFTILLGQPELELEDRGPAWLGQDNPAAGAFGRDPAAGGCQAPLPASRAPGPARELSFNGFAFHEFVVERSAAYVSQQDVHYGELTVRETFEFSARVQSSGYKRALVQEVMAREAEMGITPDPVLDAYMKATAFGGKSNLIVEVIIKLLGLDVCADTLVGNAMLRGISGGQKKRVTTGEQVVGPSKLLCADEISTGLDSNTTFHIMQAFRNFSHTMRATMLIGLLQPQPETYEVFDEVMIIAAGKGLGFECPPRRGVADFLQEVTTPSDQHKYWSLQKARTPYRFVTVKMIENAFLATPHAREVAAELATPFDRAAADNHALSFTKRAPLPSCCGAAARGATRWLERRGGGAWGPPRRELLRANFWRTLMLQRRSKIMLLIRTFQVALMSFVVATVFWREDKNTVQDGQLFFAVLFYSILYMLLGGGETSRAGSTAQRDARFYPGWAFAIPTFVMRIPWSFVESTIWTNMVYWLVGFSPSVRRGSPAAWRAHWAFLQFWLQLFLTNLWSISLFQCIAAIACDDTIATSIGSFMLLILINLTGFVLSRNKIPPWWYGGYWGNPYSYVTRALAINEFTSGHWMKPDPINGGLLGPNILAFRSFPSEYWWCWVSVGFVIGTMCLNVCGLITACTFLGAPKQRRVISEESLKVGGSADPIGSCQAQRAQAGQRESACGDTAEPSGNWSQIAPAPILALLSPLCQEFAESRKELLSPPPSAKPSMDVEAGGVAPPPAGAAGPADIQLAAWQPEAGGVEDGAGAPSDHENGRVVVESISPRHAFMLRASQRISRASQEAAAYKERTALPFDPVVVTFRSVEYSVPLPKDADPERADVPSEGPHARQLRLLAHVSGTFRPQVLTALMGASGAGKTTLMDVLAGRKTGGVVTGDIRVNGWPKDQAAFARMMGYVEQTDIHLPSATVVEALALSAHLRLPATVDPDTRRQFVEEMMALVELDRLRNAYIGVPGVSGLSVEQRKRLTLAVELDEPTSGLDARAAGIVMDAIRSTVDTGRTVVATIHQPSLDIFEAFDELLLLKPGGRTVFFGPMGDSSERLIGYFEGVPGVKPIPPRHNPATWMLEVTSPGMEEALGIDFAQARPRARWQHIAQASPPGAAQRGAAGNTSRAALHTTLANTRPSLGPLPAQAYASSALAAEMDGVVRAAEEEPGPNFKKLELGGMHAPGPWVQFTANLRRNFTLYWRTPSYNITRFVITVFVGLAFGSMFWRLGDDRGRPPERDASPPALATRTLRVAMRAPSLGAGPRLWGVLFSSCLFLGISNCLTIQPHISMQRTVYYRERAAGKGRGRSCGSRRIGADGKFFWFFFYFFLTLNFFTFFGIAAVNLTPNVALSNILCSFFFGFWNLLSGFVIQQPRIPGYWVWAFWVNPVMWQIYGLVITQLRGFDDEYITSLSGETQTIPEFLNSYFDYKTGWIGQTIAVLIAFIIVCSATAALALRYINYQRR